jgi:hypothetical protein
MSDSSFKPIWSILNALRSHDEALAESLDRLRTQLGHSGECGSLPRKIISDLPFDIDVLLPGFSQNLKLAIVEEASSAWEYYFGLLTKAVIELGTTRLAATCRFEGKPLGIWVHAQRRGYKGMKGWGYLSSDRIARLESLSDWTWDPYDYEWEEAFDLLCKYAKRTGTTRMPRGHKLGNRAIDAWCTHQRTSYKDGDLSADRVERLSALPNWSWDPISEDWHSAYQALIRFQRKHGNVSVPKNHELKDGRLLFAWMCNQRNRYKNSKLAAERIHLLEKIPGWFWDFYTEEWLSTLTDVKAHARKYGHLPDKGIQGNRGSDLGQWIETNRRFWRRKKLAPDQVSALEELPGWTWNPGVDRDSRWLEALITYRESHGHLKVPYDYTTPSGLRLGNWVAQKRIRYRNKSLSKDWISRLSALDGWIWGVRESLELQWEHAYRIVARVARQQGHCVFAGNLRVDGVHLGSWAQFQRRAGRNGRLPEFKRRRLEKIPGWEWSTKDTAYRLRTKSVPKGRRNQ